MKYAAGDVRGWCVDLADEEADEEKDMVENEDSKAAEKQAARPKRRRLRGDAAIRVLNSEPESEPESEEESEAEESGETLEAVATADSVSCPKCQMAYPISEEAYGAVAECEECGSSFLIKPPA